MKKIIVALIIVIVSFTSPIFAGSFTGDSYIKQLTAPKIGAGSYMFTVFGDTRTSGLESLDGHDVVFSLARNQIFKGIQEQLTEGKAVFSLFTGDLIWQGGKSVYWEEPGTYFPQSVRGKIYPIPGNHETWEDPDLSEYFSFFPHLNNNHNYYFTSKGSLFLSLCTGGHIGKYSKETAFIQDRKFTCTKATYDQLQLPLFLKKTAAQMAQSGTSLKNIFVQYHKPSFSYFKHPPLNKKNDPVEALKGFAKNNGTVQMVVFNGHNHTTELYQPALNISVLVAGGGGAPQKTLSTGLPSSEVKEIYKEKGAKEVFWEGVGKTTKTRTKRVNYWTVDVDEAASQVTVTEKVLTFNGLGPVFVDGLILVNGQIK